MDYHLFGLRSGERRAARDRQSVHLARYSLLAPSPKEHLMPARQKPSRLQAGMTLGVVAPASDFTLTSFRRALMETEPFDILPDPDDPYVETLVPGVAEGELVGGCLPLIISLMGTPWELDLRGRVLFFENVHRQPYE